MKKINTHKGITVRVLLDNGATGMFMDKKFAEKNGFKIEELKRPCHVPMTPHTNHQCITCTTNASHSSHDCLFMTERVIYLLHSRTITLLPNSHLHQQRTSRYTERCKRGFSCYKQNMKGSSNSPQLHAKGSKGRMTERGDKSD